MVCNPSALCVLRIKTSVNNGLHHHCRSVRGGTVMEILPSIFEIAMTAAGLVFGLLYLACALYCVVVLITLPFVRVK